jgi:DNA polymerase-3 subunit alpha
MGKKKVEEMERHRSIFVKEATSRGVDEKQAGEIFGLMEKFAGYGFNKSHSAAYALVSYQTAFLKANFTTEFLAAVLTNESSNTDQIARIFEECGALEIEVRGPDLNRSERHFSVEGKTIFFGLEAIKGLGSAVVEAILVAREKHGEFQSFLGFCNAVDLRAVNRRAIEALIKGGAFDFTGRPRSQLLSVTDQALIQGQSMQAFEAQGQGTLLGFCASQGEEFSSEELDFPDIEEFPEREVLNFEKEALGFYLSGHPLHEHRSLTQLISQTSVPRIPELAADTSFCTVGIIKSLKKRRIKRSGKDMMIVELEDLQGSSEFPVFSELLERVGPYLIEDEIILLAGKVIKNRDGDKKATVEAILPIENMAEDPSWAVTMTVTVDHNVLRSRLAKLRNALLAHPGSRRLILQVEVDNAKAVIQLGDAYRIAPDRTLVEALNNLLGEKCVKIDLRPPPPPERRRGKGPPPPRPKPEIKAVSADRNGPPKPEEVE